jgi:hypothetical protein
VRLDPNVSANHNHGAEGVKSGLGAQFCLLMWGNG